MRLREDVWESGRIIDSRPTDIEVEITKIERFPSFATMLKAVGLGKALPSARSIEEALSIYQQFYSVEDEKKFGVLAFHFKLV